MNRSFVRQAALAVTYAALAVGVAVLPATPVLGASFTFSDTNCASFSLTGSNGSYTLSCASLNCSIAAAPSANVAPSASITLAASCVPKASATATYTWTLQNGGDPNCPPQTQLPAANAVNAFSTAALTTVGGAATATPFCTYQVQVSDGGNGGGTATSTVSWTNAPPPVPSGCSIVQTSPVGTLPVGGGTVVLTASCSVNPGAVTSWTWTGGFAASMTSAVVNGNVAATTTFNATANYTGGTVAATPLTVTVATGGGGGGANCTPQGFAVTHNLTLNWGPVGTGNVQVFSTGATPPGFGYKEALVVQFTTPSGTSASVGNFSVYEYASPATIRTAALSTTACDFTGLSQSLGKEPKIYFTVGGGSVGYVNLAPNTTYYLNIENAWGTTNYCPQGSCDVGVELGRPAGL